jgi:hypothetical protein
MGGSPAGTPVRVRNTPVALTVPGPVDGDSVNKLAPEGVGP